MDEPQTKRRKRWVYAVHHVGIALISLGIGLVLLGVIYVDHHFPRQWRMLGSLSFWTGIPVALWGVAAIHIAQCAGPPPDTP